ncbi:hypothetical protein N7533_012710 [Penicillium manginii]|uniref:uncharacterized protein n=1 Tax=Penicillium manginii TaxID=203109 RepID=UPI0025488BAC|nr:uncharacterized protein N7533_012710 [Penicillium manginii]KAJ5739926.1 hypothetical protein N7533_012710 [Penicillium manginii]
MSVALQDTESPQSMLRGGAGTPSPEHSEMSTDISEEEEFEPPGDEPESEPEPIVRVVIPRAHQTTNPVQQRREARGRARQKDSALIYYVATIGLYDEFKYIVITEIIARVV